MPLAKMQSGDPPRLKQVYRDGDELVLVIEQMFNDPVYAYPYLTDHRVPFTDDVRRQLRVVLEE